MWVTGISTYASTRTYWETATETIGAVAMAFLCGAAAYTAKLGIDYMRKRFLKKELQKPTNIKK